MAAKSSTAKNKQPPAVAADAPAFTQEGFEKELQALASKAKEDTTAKWAKEQLSVFVRSGTLLTLAAIYSNLSQFTLAPVYGGIPSSIWHSKGIMTASFIGWSANLFLKRHLPLKPIQLLPLVAAYIPMVQFFAFKFSTYLGPQVGPVVTEALTFLPLLALSVSCTATILDDLELTSGNKLRWLLDPAPGITSYVFFKSVERYSRSFLWSILGKTLITSLLGLQLLMTGIYSVLAPSKLIRYAIPALLHTTLLNTHFQAPWTTASLNSTLLATDWKILERQDSNTGVISIIENSKDKFRAMRCDHSLLGGEWLLETNGPVGEPIYGIFVMLEAIRLIERPNPVADTQANALVIGLGIGTTPAALMAHGIWTTIVEIDPVVHDFATKYFGLPETHTKVIDDAVSYAALVAGGFDYNGNIGRKFDYIVHDVFTGGAEPVELFTLEFLQDLKTMLNPDGVIAINYAGDFMLPPARIIVNTIRTVFPSCRMYRESARPSAAVLEKEKRDFTNMVIFCTATKVERVTFRRAVEKDYLGTRARQAFLMPKHEVPGSRFKEQGDDGGVLLRNGTERFRKWQQQSALGHWSVMRGVLPKQVWEGW
ncbi:spermine synthase [Coleophoma crateriformis]|uniref:Spermine synthase n=1 Tax=Coleophoma crateriformis TaxID=565419 RepID=A0A3D8RCU3_9HELO|nr:spermine synthase [Coleophoma crateriformis]